MNKYIFFIDFSGHINDTTSQTIVKGSTEPISWVKVLGPYPASRG